ncbi:MAG: DNA-directed RNA polymerase subunit omega [Planctomycetes bacterium]|nr:DNA-directed RNA polymerase subunit omega [Planctomycetota bacterium]MCC7173014.1 DNA-directed RNA polymerase subunit omega [Planctomycetota bacterium]
MDRQLVWELSSRCGGIFKFTVLLQKRVQELVRGQPKLIKDPSTNPVDIALKEIKAGLVNLEFMTPVEIDEMKRSMEEQAAAQTLLQKEQEIAKPGDPSTRAISEFLKS